MRDGVRKASAIVTDSRSQIHHHSELSHEMNIPCVGGTDFATRLLQDEQEIILDSTSGLVYGKVYSVHKKIHHGNMRKSMKMQDNFNPG